MKTLTLTKGLLADKPEYCIVSGIITGISAVVLAWHGGMESQKKINQKERDENRKLKTIEKIGISAKLAVAPILASSASTALTLYGSNTYKKKQLGLVAAAYAAENRLQNYKDELKKHIPEGEEPVLDDIEKKANERIISTSDYYVQTGYGDQPFVDCITGIHFLCSEEHIRTACADMSCAMMSDMSVGLDDFYYNLNLSTDHNYASKVLGWNVNQGPIKPVFSTTDDTWNGRHITILDFTVKPSVNYLSDQYYG